ncbi:MAG TPA: hypothetical protein PLP29_10335 [Candidatus Ozemobacteraceae bacterium]|nr:hypothetical protein [Candidatus Ozemobacteraceae bacterium]
MKSRRMLGLVVAVIAIAWHGAVFAAASNPEAAQMYQQAEEAFKNKDIENACNLMFEALKKEPDNAVYRYIYAKMLFQKKDFLTSKENFDIVARSRPSKEKEADYNEKLKNFKKKIKELQDGFNQEGEGKFSIYLKNQDSPEKIKLAVTLYQAFRLNPPLRYKNYEELKKATEIYEQALQKSFQGQEWQKGPMLQLAFLYEIANKKDKAAEVYMRALDYVGDPNEEYVITHKFDYLNRSNKEKLLDTIEAGDFSQKDLEELMGSGSEKITDEEKKKVEDMIAEARSKLENATSEEEREQVLEEIKASIIEKQKKGELPGQGKLEEKLKKEGKTMEDYMKEKGL